MLSIFFFFFFRKILISLKGFFCSLSLPSWKNRPYLKNIKNNLRKCDLWKIQLTIAISFISSMDFDEECVMHSKIDNLEIMINDEADEVTNKFLIH